MATVTEPILTDATGQDIVDKLDELVGAVRPDASDIPLTPPSGMTATNVQDGFSEIKQSLSDLDTVSETNLEVSDSKNFCSTINTRKVYKWGNLKIANIIVVINPNTTAIGNTWTKVFTLPEGYESLLSASTVACEVPLTVATKAINNMAIVQARIYNKNEIQFVLREPATGNYTYYAQMVYV